MVNKGVKVFGIGFHKTGTTSLRKALETMGYNAIHGGGVYEDEGLSLIKLIEKGIYKLPTIEKYDAFTDNPYFSIWKNLDLEYPGSKFILTLREENEWIDSCIRFYQDRKVRPMRKWMFGEHANPASSPEAKQAWLRKYRSHNKNIVAHFKNRSEDLLIITLGAGNEYEVLCSFLELPLVKEKFPYVNISNKESFGQRLKRNLGYWSFRLRHFIQMK